jgi:hypothetical protein
VLNHIVYDSFGQVTSESDPSFDFRFGYTGRKLDEETGMMSWAQDFDPAVRIVWVRTCWGLGQRTDSSIAVSSGLQGAAILLAQITSALR